MARRRSIRVLGAVAAGLTLACLGVVLSVLLARKPDRSVAELTARWGPPPSVFVEVDGLRIHLRDEGPRNDPEPIVMLHGSGASLHTWSGWAAVLQRHRRVITLDLPGFGLTGPSVDADYSAAGYARFAIKLLDRLEIRRATLVGRAVGGEAAWRAALNHPARVSRLVLIAPGGYAFRSESVPIGFRIADSRVLSFIAQVAQPRWLVKSSLRNLYGDPDLVTEETVDCYLELRLRAGNRQALVQQRRQLRPAELAHRIAEVQAPTLILWGGRDRLFPPSLGERFKRDLQGSELILFPRLGHILQEEDPAGTVAAVERWLAGR